MRVVDQPQNWVYLRVIHYFIVLKASLTYLKFHIGGVIKKLLVPATPNFNALAPQISAKCDKNYVNDKCNLDWHLIFDALLSRTLLNRLVSDYLQV